MDIDVADVLGQVKQLSDFQKETLVSLASYYEDNGRWPSALELANSMPDNHATQRRVAASLSRLRKRGAAGYSGNHWELRDPCVVIEQTPAEVTLLTTIATWRTKHDDWPTINDLANVESDRRYEIYHSYYKQQFPTLASFKTVHIPAQLESGIRAQVQLLRRRGYVEINGQRVVIVSDKPTAN